MRLPIFQIDSFTDEVFHGNPAGVCRLERWIDRRLLQEIAAEMNLSETAFFAGERGVYEIRWFTPTTEVDLCGHATLASAWVLAHEYGEESDPIRFASRSGELRVWRRGARFALDFPADPPLRCEVPERLLSGLGVEPVEVLGAVDYLVILHDEEQVRGLTPDLEQLAGLPRRGVIVTAPGRSVDFVSRWFGPNVGVPEDPVTGSAHTILTPYWSARLGKSVLQAHQLSKRGGALECALQNDRVYITGSAVKFLEGTITL